MTELCHQVGDTVNLAVTVSQSGTIALLSISIAGIDATSSIVQSGALVSASLQLVIDLPVTAGTTLAVATSS